MTPANPSIDERPRKVRKDEVQRQRILEAASTCFGDKGFTRATLDEIADAAFVSKPLIYKYFKGKAELLNGVLEDVFDRWVLHTEAAVKAEVNGAARFAAKLRGSVEFVRAQPVLVQLFMEERRQILSGQQVVFGKTLERSRNLTRDILLQGIEAGEWRSELDVDATAEVIELVTIALVEGALGTGGFGYHEALQQSTLVFILDAIAVTSDAS